MMASWPEIAHFARRNALWILLVLAFTPITAPNIAAAQTWRVDSRLSYARLALGSDAHAAAIGVARIRGQIALNPDRPVNPSIDLEISPANDAGVQMRFTSTRSAMNSEGDLLVTGDLAVTRVERSITLNLSEAFSGPVYGQPVAHTDTHLVTFVLHLSRQETAAHSTLQLNATATISRGDFPQFLDSLTEYNWPTELVNDPRCDMPSTPGEDFAGARCTGATIASMSDTPVKTGSGEAFSGFRTAVNPDLDHGMLIIDVILSKVKPASTTASAETALLQPAPIRP